MDEIKQNDTENRGETGPVRVQETVRGKVEGDGNVGEYSYTVVYAQESVWVLDLRLDTNVSGLDRLIWGILRARLEREGYKPEQIRYGRINFVCGGDIEDLYG